jgi:putative peptidoglycan lipid II flippase
MALGTLASRITGFLRTAVFGYALGAGTLADAYNNANALPNTVYNLALGGILTSVVVPLLVARRSGTATGARAATSGSSRWWRLPWAVSRWPPR